MAKSKDTRLKSSGQYWFLVEEMQRLKVAAGTDGRTLQNFIRTAVMEKVAEMESRDITRPWIPAGLMNRSRY